MTEQPTTPTPEERAYCDALADAVKYGIHGEEALRYADHMRGTAWFQGRALHHALIDFRVALRRTGLGRLVDRLVKRA